MHGLQWRRAVIGVGLGAVLILPEAVTARLRPAPAPLRLEQVVADSDDAFHVVATIVVGRSESVLWDGQYRVADGRRLADRVAATGTRLKAIVISHADHDHYMGAQAVLDRFPGTPVYMAASTLADFRERSARDLEAERKRPNHDAPETLVTPQPLPQAPLTVDGQRLEVVADFAGDVPRPASSILWIPSLRAALAADLVFNGVHPWLGESDIASRAAWRASLERLAALKPAIVVPGHKVDPAAPDSPDQIAFMRAYLDDFDASMQAVSTPLALVTAMRDKYPQLRIPALMAGGARRFRQ